MTTTDDEALRLLGDAAEHVRTVVHLRPAWTDPASLYDAAGLLDELTRTLHALFGHASRCCGGLASCAYLRADELGEPVDAATLARGATLALDTAAHTLDAVNTDIGAAHGHLAQLYLDTPGNDGSTT